MQYQPFTKGEIRPPGPALDAMKTGRSLGGWNSADVTRGAALVAAHRNQFTQPPRKPHSQRLPRGFR